MHSVHVYKGDLDRALRALKTKMDIDSVLEEVKNRRNFETSGQKRKRKSKALDRKRKQGR
jgi:small subunit ribosomal protein S21